MKEKNNKGRKTKSVRKIPCNPIDIRIPAPFPDTGAYLHLIHLYLIDSLADHSVS